MGTKDHLPICNFLLIYGIIFNLFSRYVYIPISCILALLVTDVMKAMMDRMLMVTRKFKLKIGAVRKTLDKVNKEISENADFIIEAEKLSEVIMTLKDFEADIDELEHVILAEGIR